MTLVPEGTTVRSARNNSLFFFVHRRCKANREMKIEDKRSAAPAAPPLSQGPISVWVVAGDIRKVEHGPRSAVQQRGTTGMKHERATE